MRELLIALQGSGVLKEIRVRREENKRKPQQNQWKKTNWIIREERKVSNKRKAQTKRV